MEKAEKVRKVIENIKLYNYKPILNCKYDRLWSINGKINKELIFYNVTISENNPFYLGGLYSGTDKYTIKISNNDNTVMIYDDYETKYFEFTEDYITSILSYFKEKYRLVEKLPVKEVIEEETYYFENGPKIIGPGYSGIYKP